MFKNIELLKFTSERSIYLPVMRSLHHPAAGAITLEGVLHALSDPARLQIVRNLDESCPRTCGEAGCPSLPRSTLSHHFRILREAGLVRSERDGVSMRNTLRRDELDKRFPGLLAAVLSQDCGSEAD
ncbi:ArsR/SmtB family transcription factor [Euryhalocaulis caribicus]|uniref:ArsR/SmtB family transcription factor n=1 Tax=Euryhalocaulis caribicus TaxID=1161401 RepID=UPI0003A3D491|nr:helix-turn-helix domain-containing protein [Euryhalocaulis caribicus]